MHDKAVIFDLDGVLTDTARYHYRAWKSLADELNIPFNEQLNEQLKGVSRQKSLDIILKNAGLHLSDEQKMKLLEQKNRLYLQFIANLGPNDLLPGIDRLLPTLKKEEIPLAVGSASKNARRVLDALGIGCYFDAIVDGHAVMHPKPHPEVFLRTARMLGIPPGRCIVVEDARAGIEAAKRAGMKAIAVGASENFPEADASVPDTQSLTYDFLKAFL